MCGAINFAQPIHTKHRKPPIEAVFICRRGANSFARARTRGSILARHITPTVSGNHRILQHVSSSLANGKDTPRQRSMAVEGTAMITVLSIPASRALWREYAHFEGEVPSVPTPAPVPPSPTPEPSGDPAWLPERLKRAEKAAAEAERKKLLAELGIEDADADKQLLAAARKRKADEQSEVEKAQGELAKEKAKRETAEQALADYRTAVEAEKRASARDSAIKQALDDAKAKSGKVLALLQVQHADAVTAVLKDDGTVDTTKVTALVETARKAYPEDFGRAGVGTPSNSDGRAPSGANQDGQRRAAQTSQRTIRG